MNDLALSSIIRDHFLWEIPASGEIFSYNSYCSCFFASSLPRISLIALFETYPIRYTLVFRLFSSYLKIQVNATVHEGSVSLIALMEGFSRIPWIHCRGAWSHAKGSISMSNSPDKQITFGQTLNTFFFFSNFFVILNFCIVFIQIFPFIFNIVFVVLPFLL